MNPWKRLKRPDPKREEEKLDQLSQVKVGWKDRLAMLLSAYMVLGLPAVIILVLLCLAAMALFGLF